MNHFFEGLNIIFSAFFVIFFVGLCIFIHELGHFFAAKWRKLHITAFSIGFKKIWAVKRGGIEYRIGCIPIGGYVELPQIDSSGEIKDENGNLLPPIKPLDKILVTAAGPLCNILLGLALGIFIWIHGLPLDTPKMDRIEVARLLPESPEYKAGLRDGDVIHNINGKKFYGSWSDFVQDILFTTGEVKLGITRGSESVVISYLPAPNKEKFPSETIAYPFFMPKIPIVINPLKNSPAAKAGLQKNDIIVSVNGQALDDYGQFAKFIEYSNGNPLSFGVIRNGKHLEIKNIVPEKISSQEQKFRMGVEYSPEIPLRITNVLPDSPAYKAGLLTNDIVIKINGKEIDTPNIFFEQIQESQGKKISLQIKRGDKIIEIPEVFPELAASYTIGTQFIFYAHPTPLKLFVETIEKTYKTLKGIFSKKSTLKAKNLSGPIGIVHSVGKIVYYGQFVLAVYIVVFITYSLAIFNLLPIPVLDGGHIVISLIEMIIGKPVPERLIKPVFTAFIILLIGLMIFVTYHDIMRLIVDFK